MTSLAEQELIEIINLRLDGEALVRAIGFHTDKMRVLGKSLKTPCFVHGDQKFATLLIHQENHSGKCMVGTCPAFQELSLVRLYALWKQVDELDAALEAAHLTGLDVSDSRFGKLLEGWLAEAKELAGDGKHEESQALFARASKLAPRNVSIHLESAHLAESTGNAQRALELFLLAAHAAQANAQPDEGLRILREEALRIAPDEREVLEEVAWVFAALDNAEEGASILSQAADRAEDPQQARALLEKAREIAPLSVAVELRLAQLLANQGEREVAAQAFLDIAERMRDADKPDITRVALQGAVRAQPERADYLEMLMQSATSDEDFATVAEFLDDLAQSNEDAPVLLVAAARARTRANGAEAARQLHHRLLLAYTAREDTEATRALFEELAEGGEDTTYWREQYGDWLAARGEIQSAVAQFRTSIEELGESRQERVEALRLLERMAQIDSFAPEIRLLLARSRADLGDEQGAEADYLEAAHIYQQQSKETERRDVLVELVDKLPTRDMGLQFLTETLIAEDRSQDAIDCLRRTSERRVALNHTKNNVWLFENLAELQPEDEAVREGLARAFEDSGNITSAIDNWRKLAARRVERGEYAGAAVVLAEAIRIRPDDLDLLMERLEALDKGADESAYRMEAVSLLQRASTDGEVLRAETVIRRLSEKFPEDVSSAERMAELEIRSGKVSEGCGRLRAAAESLAREGKHSEAVRLLQLVLESDPNQLEVADRLLELLEEAGSRPDLLAGLLKVAMVHLSNGQQAKALDCIARYEARADWQWDDLRLSCVLLASHGMQDRAHSTIRNFLKSSAPSEGDVIAACEYGLQVAGDEKAFAERLLAIHEKRGDDEAALRTGMRLASILGEQGDRKGALKVLESLKRNHPNSKEPRVELARFHEESSRKIDAKVELAAIAVILRGQARLAEARTFYQRATALDPTDIETGLEYASCLEESNERQEAADEIRRLAGVARGRGDFDRAAELFARLFEITPDDMEVRSEFVELLREHSSPERAAEEALQLAHRWFRDKDSERGIEWVRRAVACMPDSAETATHAAELLFQHGQTEEGFACLAQAAATHRQSGGLEEASRIVSDGLARDEGQVELLAELAEIQLAQGLQAEAVGTLRKLAVVHDNSGRVRESEEVWRRILDIIPESTADHEEFIGVLQRQGPSRKTDALEALKRLCAFHLGQGMRADAITCYQRQLEIDPQSMDVRAELAHAFFEEDRFKEASQQFMLLAAAYRQAGKVKLAIDYLGKVIELDSQNIEALQIQVELTLSEGRIAEFSEYSLRLASLLESADRMAEAIAVLRTAVEADRENLDLRPILASYLIKSGDTEEGIGIYLETARRHLTRKKKQKAVEVLDRVRALPDPGLSALEGLGELYLVCGESQAAQSILRSVAERFRESADADGLDRVLEILIPLLTKDGKLEETLEWQLSLARVQISQGMVEQARDLLEKVGEARGGDRSFHEAAAAVWAENRIPELAAQEFLCVARLHMESEEWREARTWCLKALEGRSREIAGREMLAECLRQLGEIDEACQTLAQLASLYEDALQSAGAAEVLARMVEWQPEEPSHLERLADALEKLGRKDELAGTLRILAQVYEKRGDLEKAIESLRRLKSLRPDDTRVRSSFIRLHRSLGREKAILEDMVHLANLQIHRGDRQDALATLQEAASLDPEWPDANERLLNLHLEDGRNEEAIDTAMTLVESYLRSGAFREASIALQRVKRLAGEDPRHRMAQANIHMAQNARGMALREYEEAAKLFAAKGDVVGRTATIARIIEIDPQNLEVRHHLIECLRSQGRYAAAAEAQRQLAEVYCNRGLWDLAEAEYREIVSLDPQDHSAWQSLFNAHLQIGDERELIPDYLGVSQIMLASDKVNDAIHYLAKATSLEPRNIEARERYIEAYKKVGDESELCEEYLRLADLYVEAGRVDDGIALYNQVMTLDPGNAIVRDRLSETHARRNKGHKQVGQPSEGHAPEKPLDQDSKPRPRTSRERPTPIAAADFLAEEIENLEKNDHDAALEQVIASYRDILAINAQNANVRIKLAELYLQKEERDKALEELRAASETLLQKGELAPCIAVCERILKMMPTDLKVRNRLKQAFNKRDAFKALESAILFSDGDESDVPPGRGGPGPKDRLTE